MEKISHFSIKKKLIVSLTLIIFVFALLFCRLFYLQVLWGETLQYMAYDQWTRELPFRADRGDIVDTNGIVLAKSSTSYTLYARPNELVDVDIDYVASSIADIVGMSKTALVEKLSRKGVSEITVAKSLSKEQMLALIATDVNGLYLTANSERYYSYGNFLTQVLGFTNSDGVGQSGVELYYDDYLKGVNGASYTQTDLIGRQLSSNVTTYVDSVKGMTTQLTIDYYMQSFAEKAVEDAQKTYNSNSASCIIMSANTGAVLAMASAPTYDLNDIPRNDMELLLQGSRNLLVNDVYEPGSTFKILTSAIGLEESAIKNSYYCSGGSIVDGQRIKCWRSIGHGSQNFQQGIQNSCNCVFMDIALTVGKNTMYDYFSKFGIGAKTGVDVSGEAGGIMLNLDRVQNVDIARIGFGQAIAVTPIQLVSAVCSVVNGGKLYTPYVVDKIVDVKGNTAYQHTPIVKNTTVSQSTSSIMKEYLYSVVSEGGGKNAYVAGYNIGGKTGTAQKYENGAIAQGKYISSFLGFTDVGDDTLVCLLLVDEPQGYSYYGSIVAAPFVGKLFTSIFSYKNIKPTYADGTDLGYTEIEMPNLVGMSSAEALVALKQVGLDYEMAGDGGKVTYQFPVAGQTVRSNAVVFFSTE
ncbi:MAG: PASTA domain-containing protein [Clostridia bacterium]|nr:PASTA domain-containing protein [Clostridia bacterium]MDE7328330.1 PASTA domain-containing protein [Clostridia bacterium]